MATTTEHIDYTERGSAPTTPATGHWRVFTKSDGLYIVDDAGTVTGPFVSNTSAAVPSAHGCKVTRDTSDQSVGNNTFTAVQYNATDTLDTDAMHDPASNNTRVTIPSISGVTTGLWRFTASGYTSATALRADVKLRKGGSTDYRVYVGCTGPSGAFSYFGTWLVVCTAADYFETLVRTTSGSFNVVATDATSPPTFEVEFLGKVT